MYRQGIPSISSIPSLSELNIPKTNIKKNDELNHNNNNNYSSSVQIPSTYPLNHSVYLDTNQLDTLHPRSHKTIGLHSNSFSLSQSNTPFLPRNERISRLHSYNHIPEISNRNPSESTTRTQTAIPIQSQLQSSVQLNLNLKSNYFNQSTNEGNSHGISYNGEPYIGRSMGSFPLNHSFIPLNTNHSLNHSQSSYSIGTSRYSSLEEDEIIQDKIAMDHSKNNNEKNNQNDNGNIDSANKKRERNRIAARKSRQRKMDRVEQLKTEQKELQQRHEQLVKDNLLLEKTLEENILLYKNSSDSFVRMDDAYSMPQTIEDNVILKEKRIEIIKKLEEAINTGDLLSVKKYFNNNSVISGPQSSYLLRGKDCFVADYASICYLYNNFHIKYTNISNDDNDEINNPHFRINWTFSGEIKNEGKNSCEQFTQIIRQLRNKRITFSGWNNITFGNNNTIVYIHRSTDQGKFLATLISMKQQCV